MKAGDDLRKEHDAILFALGILEKMIAPAEGGGKFPAKDAEEMVDFLKIFADKCHHGKEEGFLFEEYEKAGVGRENGPIGVMLQEHGIGRSHIGAMTQALRQSPPEAGLFARAARAYIDLLRSHIEKENTVLFPMGDPGLSEEKNREILDKFERYEEEIIGSGKHEELHAMLDGFAKKYA